VGLKGSPPRTLAPQHSLHLVQQATQQVQEVRQQVPEANLIDVDAEPLPETAMPEYVRDDQAYIASLCTIKDTDLPQYSVVCNGVVVGALIDSGASASYVSPRIIGDCKTKTVLRRSVEMAGGHTLTINKQVTLTVVNAG
jgi:hypothetical protein